MPRIELEGCRTQPLGSYLKALAVLRLISQQIDREARGQWTKHYFCLESELDEVGLVQFFLEHYRPTPVVAPWNGGSGFYPKDRKVGIDGIARSTDPRFEEYRRTIAKVLAIPEIMAAEKAAKKAEEIERRRRIQCACRNWLPDSAVDWLDAAVAITSGGDRAFPPILGTGGNEGRLDYTNNFMERLVRLFLEHEEKPPMEGLLRHALFEMPVSGLDPSAVGQYDPGRAGGPNQAQGVSSPDFPSNPWNFVLTIEGAVAWASGLHRRQCSAYSRAFLCSPFTVMPRAVGYNSAAQKDEQLARAEIWAPVWSQPASYREIEALLREGRADVSGRPAANGLEFAQAATSLGVDRGIEGFMRFGLMKRRGDSYIALPAGYFRIEERRHRDLIEQLHRVLDRLGHMDASASLGPARRELSEAVYQYLLRGTEERFVEVIVALGRVQRHLLLHSADSTVRLRPTLKGGWLDACAHGPEGRIAAALAMMRSRQPEDHTRVLPIRENLARSSRSFAWVGVNVAERLAGVLARRVLDAEREGAQGNPLWSPFRVHPWDVSAFLEGLVDDELLEALLCAFTLVEWTPRKRDFECEDERSVPNYYALMRQAFDPDVVTDQGKLLRGEPRVLPLLGAGRVREACAIVERRLTVSGLNPVRVTYSTQANGVRLAAALLIPVHGMETFYERVNISAVTTA